MTIGVFSGAVLAGDLVTTDDGKAAYRLQISGGGAAGGPYQLATNQTLAANANTSTTNDPVGGAYVFAYQFGGTSPSLILEALGPDGATYQTIVTVTASGSQMVGIGRASVVRLRNGTGNAITGLSASLS